MMIKELAKNIDTYLSYSNLLDNTHKVRFLSESESNINFLVDAENSKYLFRLNKSSKLGIRNQIRYEYDALKTLEKSHVTPRTFFLDDSSTFFEYGAMIMQYIVGRPLEYKKDVNEAARIFATIHSIDTEKIDISSFVTRENIVEDSLNKSKIYLDRILKSSKIDTKLKLKISDFFDWAEKNKSCQIYFKKNRWNTINNTEPHAKNFIISQRKERGYMIDWEQAVISDSAVDISYFLSPLTTSIYGDYILSKDEVDNFLKTYIMYLDKDNRDIVERVKLYTPYAYLRILTEMISESIDSKDEKFTKVINAEFLNMITKGIL